MKPYYEHRPFVYLSLGAGVQSSALLLCSTKGLHSVPRADVAIFADTQQEPHWVYEQVEALRGLSDIPIETVTAGDLGQAIDEHKRSGGFARIPAFTRGKDGRAAPLRRQCTREYKIAPIQKHVRTRLGYKPRQRVKHQVICLVGISLDEIERASPAPEKWIDKQHPLAMKGLRRDDCVRLLEAHEWPVPKKSACIFCPYHDDRFWTDLKDNHPHEWQRAVEFDVRIRDLTKAGVRRQAFLHRSLVPLRDVTLQPDKPRPLFDSFGAECTGVCGI